MKIKKTTKFIILSVVAFLTFQPFALCAQTIMLKVNNKQLNTEMKMINNKVYVPLEETFKSLGATVTRNDINGTYTIEYLNDEDKIPNIIRRLSKSVVGVIGNLSDTQSYSDDKYVENIIHGTGIIIKSTGEILTNAHVVKNMEKIIVVLYDGTGYEATLKCIDDEADLALIKIPKTNLTPVVFGSDKDIVIGRTVIAMGTPASFSLMNSATAGIISGLNRSSNSQYKLIQTDASISPGNSGGPLVTMEGKVIGINSSKYVGGGIEGIGFSIPANTINYVLNQFATYGKVKRPYMGTNFEEDWIAKIGLPSSNGLKIVDVDKNSPASKFGLQVEDILISINNVKINTIIDFNEEMTKYTSGNKISIKFKRGNSYQNISLKLE